MKDGAMTYAGTGVDYGAMDPFKKAAQLAALETVENLAPHGFTEAAWSRGESVYLMEGPGFFLAHVEEGLGTKNLAAEDPRLRRQSGQTFFDHIAQCTAATIINDLITLGASPLSLAMHLAVGDSSWFDDEERAQALIRGWQRACHLAGCVWSGGETPTLKGVIVPGTAMLGGSGIGVIQPKERLINPASLQAGDAIVVIKSSGIHANGLTLAHRIAAKLPDGYLTKLKNGMSYGEALLQPTVIYAALVKACLDRGIHLHYTVNVTGHGWRKLMRAPQPFAYVVAAIPEPQPVFGFIQEHGPVDDREAYGNFNMGAGFALYLPKNEVAATLKIARDLGYEAMEAGVLEAAAEKRVEIRPKNLVYAADELEVR